MSTAKWPTDLADWLGRTIAGASSETSRLEACACAPDEDGVGASLDMAAPLRSSRPMACGQGRRPEAEGEGPQEEQEIDILNNMKRIYSRQGAAHVYGAMVACAGRNSRGTRTVHLRADLRTSSENQCPIFLAMSIHMDENEGKIIEQE